MREDRSEVDFFDYEGAKHRHAKVIPDPHLEVFTEEDGDETLAGFLREAAEAVGMPLILLGHVTGDRYTVVALYREQPGEGLDQGATIPIVETYCRQEITWDKPFVLGDALADPRFVDHPGYTKHGLRAYVGAPVILPDGTVYGTLCGVDTQARMPSLEGVERLLALAKQVAQHVWGRLNGEAPPSARSQPTPQRGS